MEKSQLEARINSLISARAGEKQTVSSLEKKLAEEKKTRSDYQMKLETERKNKKEAVKAELNAAQQSVNSACVQKLEIEVAKLKDELARTEQRANTAEEEIMGLRKNTDNDKLVLQLKKLKDSEEKLKLQLAAQKEMENRLRKKEFGSKREGEGGGVAAGDALAGE